MTYWQCFQSSNAAFASHYLSHWNDDMALASILAGETQIVLRQTDLAKRVVVAEGHIQEALVHLQQIFLFGKPEKRLELLALCMSFEASVREVKQKVKSQAEHQV